MQKNYQFVVDTTFLTKTQAKPTKTTMYASSVVCSLLYLVLVTIHWCLLFNNFIIYSAFSNSKQQRNSK